MTAFIEQVYEWQGEGLAIRRGQGRATGGGIKKQ